MSTPQGKFKLDDIDSAPSSRGRFSASDITYQSLGDDPLATISKEAHKFNLQLTSNKRTSQHNAAVGGAKNSYHLYGSAADISGDSSNMQKFHDYMKNTYGTNLAELIYGTSDHLDHVHVAWNPISKDNKVVEPTTKKELNWNKPTTVSSSSKYGTIQPAQEATKDSTLGTKAVDFYNSPLSPEFQQQFQQPFNKETFIGKPETNIITKARATTTKELTKQKVKIQSDLTEKAKTPEQIHKEFMDTVDATVGSPPTGLVPESEKEGFVKSLVSGFGIPTSLEGLKEQVIDSATIIPMLAKMAKGQVDLVNRAYNNWEAHGGTDQAAWEPDVFLPMMAGLVPILGPQAAKVVDQYNSGDTAGAIGSATALGVQLLLPEIAKRGGILRKGRNIELTREGTNSKPIEGNTVGKYKPEDINISTIEDNPINIKLGDRLAHPDGYDIKVVGIGDKGISVKKVGQGKHKPMLVTKDSPVYDSITQQARVASDEPATEQGKIPQPNQPAIVESQPASQEAITEHNPISSKVVFKDIDDVHKYMDNLPLEERYQFSDALESDTKVKKFEQQWLNTEVKSVEHWEALDNLVKTRVNFANEYFNKNSTKKNSVTTKDNSILSIEPEPQSLGAASPSQEAITEHNPSQAVEPQGSIESFRNGWREVAKPIYEGNKAAASIHAYEFEEADPNSIENLKSIIPEISKQIENTKLKILVHNSNDLHTGEQFNIHVYDSNKVQAILDKYSIKETPEQFLKHSVEQGFDIGTKEEKAISDIYKDNNELGTTQIIKGYHTIRPNIKEGIGFIQRSEGTYIALDNPFEIENGVTHKANVKINPKNLYDPNGVLEGTDIAKSKADTDIIMSKWQKEVSKTLSKSENIIRDRAKARTKVLKELGYDGEVGWIDGPEGKNRELVVFDKSKVDISKNPSQEPESKSLGTTILSQFPKELSNEAGSISPDVLNKMTGGVGQFILKDIGSTIGKAYRAGKEVLNYLVPTKGVSKVGMDIMMEMKGERDEAIAKLQLRMNEAKDMFNKLPNDDNVAFMDKIKKGESQSTPELQEIADFYRTIDNEVYTQLKKYNNVPYLENHFRILWDTIPGEPQPVGLVQNIKASVLSRRPLQGSKGMLKQHTLNTVSEGIDKGGIPVSYNPQTLFELSYIDAMKYITAQRMWEVLKDNSLRKFVKLGEKAPEGFRPISDSIATVYFPAKSGEGLVHGGRWMVEDNIARILENHLSRDYIRESELGKGIVDIKNLQTMAELGLSSFHAVFEGLESVGSQLGEGFREITNVGILQANPKALVKGSTKILTAPAAPVTTARIGGSVIKYLKNPDEFLTSTRGHSFIKAFPDAKRMISDLFMGGGQIAINEGYRTGWRDSMRNSWKEGNYVGSGLRSLPAGVEKLMSPLFETYIPRLKIGTFLKEYQLALQENNKALSTGEMTRTELAKKTWNFVEDRFGEMNFDNLWWNNTFKTANQVMFRSVTWKLGNLRASAGALPEQGIGIVRDIKQGSIPKLSPKMAWLFGMSLTTAALGSIISKTSTGKYPWQWAQQDEGNIALNIAKETIFPRTSKDNPSQRVSTPTYWKDSFQLIHSPKNYIKSALSSTIGDIADVWNNEDFYGNWVYNPNDNIFKEGLDITKHFFPMPFSIQRYVEAKQKGESTGAALEGFVGITKAPYYIREPQKAAMYEKKDEYIHTLMKEHKGMSKDTATKIVDNELRKH
jgi:hypothetical protein